MKKILYILFTVSLLSVGCTKEVPVSRDYDINAEVLDIKTNLEMKTLYCNLNESEALDLQKFGEYLTAQNADVVMFVAPTTLKSVVRDTNSGESEGEGAGEGENTEGTGVASLNAGAGNATRTEGAIIGTQDVEFESWLDEYVQAQQHDGVPTWNALYARNNDGRMIMAALVKAELAYTQYPLSQRQTLNNAVLHFVANEIHFIVTDLLPARNTIPSDWEDQVAAMTTNNTPLAYDPDVLEERKEELAYIFKYIYDDEAFIKDPYWIWAMSMNAESPLDITKYNREFLRKDYYDSEVDFDWEAFLAKKTKYFSISETLDEKDPYFGVNALMNYNFLLDCNAIHHSVYTPSGINETRRNFLYASVTCWNMFQTFDFDTAFVADDMQVAHYPMIVTLKREE